jgi:hypothetical protein
VTGRLEKVNAFVKLIKREDTAEYHLYFRLI